MNWQEFGDGFKLLFSQRALINLEDIVWEGEPTAMLGYPQAHLTILGNTGLGLSSLAIGYDEVRYVSQGPGVPAHVRVVGNRAMTVSIRVLTRDQTVGGRAFVILERFRNTLYLPSTQAMFDNLRVGLDAAAALVELGRSYDFRVESEASLDLRLLFAFDTDCDCGVDGGPQETADVIESVEVGGRVNTPFNVDVDHIDITPETISK